MTAPVVHQGFFLSFSFKPSSASLILSFPSVVFIFCFHAFCFSLRLQLKIKNLNDFSLLFFSPLVFEILCLLA